MPMRQKKPSTTGKKDKVLVNPHRSSRREFTQGANTVRAKTTLPPGIQAAKRGLVKVKIDTVEWSTSDLHPVELTIGLSW